MEGHNRLNQPVLRNVIGQENPKSGMDPKIPLMGRAVKRKGLSDITNTVSSSKVANCNTQFQENPKEVTCGITKECITQLMEENATLLKALGERNKIIELSSIELQKLRFTLGKGNQQNRMLAQANSQMLAELTSSKERLKALQHELGCTKAVLRLKSCQLDEKEKLNKELSEKIRVEEKKLNIELCEKNRAEKEHSMRAEVETGASHSVTNSIACNPSRRRTVRNKTLGSTTLTHHAEDKSNNELRKKIRVEDERLNWELCEKNNAKGENSKCTEVATHAAQSHTVDNDIACKPNRKRTLRSQSAAATVTHQMEAKEKDGRRKSSRRRSNQISEARESKGNLIEIEDAKVPEFSVISETPNEEDKAEEHSKRTEVATDASRSHAVDNNMACKPNRKRTLRKSLGASATVSHQMEAKEKDGRRKSSRRRSNNLTSEAHESKDNSIDIEDAKVPAFSMISETPNEEDPVLAESSATLTHQVEAKENDDTRIRKPLRRRSNNLKSEPSESKDHFPETVDVKNPACSPIIEKTLAPSSSDASMKHEEGKAQKDQGTSSQCQGQELRRTSVGRPWRRAAEKVSSYKEVPVNVKMRRPE